jgi:basic membrane protein A
LKIGHIGILAAALFLFGCGDSGGTAQSTTSGTTSGTTGSAAPSGEKIKVGVVFDSGGRGDKSFNDSAWAGIEKSKSELGIDEHHIDSKNEKDYETNLSALAEDGCKLVFAIGITQEQALKSVAPKYPDVYFAIVDGNVDAPNVRSLKFAEEQGSFLAGYAAGLATKTNKIGFVGGMKFALIKKFEVGYIAGAKMANPNIEVLPSRYTNSWDDVGLGKAAAKVLFDSGADIVYHAAGRCGLGVIAAAKDAGKLAIGVDGNQDDVEPGFVLTSMVKHVDTAVYDTIKDVQSGKFTPGVKAYDLAAGGVGLTDFKNTKARIGDEGLKKIEAVSKMIVGGEIKVPATEEELAAFKAPALKS